MILYHYTAIPLAESILNAGLAVGHIRRSSGAIDRNVVWLTEDPTSNGHGLPNGREILSPSNIAYMEQVTGKPIRNTVTYDKTKVRLTFEIEPTDDRLQRFVDWAKANEILRFAKITGLSAVTDLSKTKESLTSLGARLKTKEKTWWLYFGSIAPEHIRAVELATPSGWTAYDFETHGRSAMYDAGLVVVAKKSLATLQRLFPTGNPLARMKAFSICVSPDHSATVQIRGDGVHLIFDIASGRQLHGPQLSNAPLVQQWLTDEKDEILRCWNEAVEVYYRIHPQEQSAA